MTPILLFRRARRDLGILLVWIALVAFAVALAVGQPRLLLQTVNAGARQAVAAAGHDADVVVSATVTINHDGQVEPVSPAEIQPLGDAIPHRLPAALRKVYGGSTLTVLGPSTQVSTRNGVPPAGSSPVAVQMAMITKKNSEGLHLVAGALPTTAGDSSTVDVVISAADAKASGLSVGSTAQVATIPVSSAGPGDDELPIRVVGIVAEAHGKGATTLWGDTPHLWAPLLPRTANAAAPVGVTVLAAPSGVKTAVRHYTDPFKASLRIRLDPHRFTSALEASVNAELVALAGHSDALAGNTGAQLGVGSQYISALSEYPARERAAIAQISVVTAGVLGVAAAVLLLVSRMLVMRRESDLVLERARGASLVSIAVRALLETLITGVIGAAIGVTVLQLALPGAFVEPALSAFVAAVVVLAVPVQTVLLVRGSWTGRKVPANREDRIELGRRARARRIAIEITVLALGVAAFVSLSARGLLETQTNGVDLLLASAPLLLAAGITIVVLRVYRWPLGAGIAAGRRSIGAIGLLAAVRAQRSIAVLPLLALTLAVALAVGGGLLASTVVAGQETASWQRIGADVRVSAAAPESVVSAIAASPGVTAASGIYVRDGIQLRLSGGTDFATIVAVDHRFASLVAKLPAGGATATGASALRALGKPSAAADALPVVVNEDLARQISSKNIGMYIGLKFLPMRVIGVTDERPAGFLDAPFVFVDRAVLSTQLGKTLTANTVFATGPGATAAVHVLHAPASAIHSRSLWLAERRHLALVRGVSQAITLATLATAVLAVLALVVTLLSGARERGRSLALVRTLGLPARLGWWLALAELAPVLLAALIGGVVSGVGIVLLLEPEMGIGELAGGLGNPAPSVSPTLIVGLVGAAIGLLLIAVLIEIAVRRRDRLSEVLRVGEST